MIGIKDTTKKETYKVTVGAVSFQMTKEEAKALAMRIEKIFGDDDSRVELQKQTIDKNLSTTERIDLIFKLKGKHQGEANTNSSKEYPIGKIA